MKGSIMKKVIVILSIVISVKVIANTPSFPSYQQAEKLVAAAWKAPPQSIDITYYVTVRDTTKTEQDLREIYEKAHEQMYGPPEKLNSYMLENRERFVRMNVGRCLKEQQKIGRRHKLRIRFDENRQRVDQVYGPPARTALKSSGKEEFLPEKKLDANTPFDMSIVEVKDVNDISTRFEYVHSNKTATRKKVKRRSSLKNGMINKLIEMPNGLLLRMKMGTNMNGSLGGPYDVNETKINQLCSGTLKDISVKIQPDKDAPDVKDRIEIILYSQEGAPFYESTLICDKEDYSKVYYSEVRSPVGKHLISTRTCSNFDSQGFPHRATLVEYDSEGKVKIHETYLVESVRLNPSIPDEIFKFNPPKDYAVTDLRLPPAERQAAEVVRLKGMLRHEKWMDRLEALAALEKHLKDKAAELRKIAATMLDDEHPAVRERASRILREIGSGE